MSTDQLTSKHSRSSHPRQVRRADIRSHLPAFVLAGLTGVLLVAFYIGLYYVNDYRFPIGWDTARYLFHTNFIAERGFGTEIPHLLPLSEPLTANRPGFPVLALALSSLFDTSMLRVAAPIPLTGAIATALAIGAFASAALGLKRWEMLVVVLMAAVSAPLIRLLAPETYTDNLMAAAICMAALLPVMAVVKHGTSFLPAMILFGIGGLIHPVSLAIVLAALAITAVAYGPSSWRVWRSGQAPLLATWSARLGLVLSGSAVAAGLGILALSPDGPDVRTVYRGELEKKLGEDLPLYRFPLTLPLAAVGAADVSASRYRTSQWRSGGGFALLLLFSWAAVTVIGILLFLAGRDVSVHRFLAFFLPLPMLMGLGILALGRLLTSRISVVASVFVVVFTVGAFVFIGSRDLYRTIPDERGIQWIDKGKIDDAITAGRYLDMTGVPANEPVVFVIDDHGPNPVVSVSQLIYVIAANLRPERTEQAHFYFGDPERYLQGKPTFRPGRPLYNQMSALLWRDIRPLIPKRPVALMLASYSPLYLETVTQNPELRTINNTVVLNGPPPPRPKVRNAIPATGPLRILGLQLATLFVLSVAGLGWAIALFPRGIRSREVLAVAPAVGIAVVVMGGLLLDRAGIRLTGTAAALTPLLVAVAGWTLAARRLVRTPDLFVAD